MTVKNCEKIEKSQVALTIEVSAVEFEAAIEKAYQKMRKQINVQGFRPGKAPRKIMEGMYGAEVFFEEAINIAFPDAYEAAVAEKELRAVGYPDVEMIGECTKEGFTFKANVPVYPEVTLGQYKGLTAPKDEVVVSAEDVDQRLKELTDRNTRLVSVDRAAQDGDTAVIDFEGFLNGTPFEGGKGENHSLELGSHSFVPGFEEQLVGVKAGEEKKVELTFPTDYHEDLAGKAVVFQVKVNEVKAKEVPALDDEFAKDVSEFDTLTDLKADLEKKLLAEREDAAKRAFEDALMDQVGANITAEIPDAMVTAQSQRFLENFKMQIGQQGIPYEQYLKMTGMEESALLEESKEPSLRQVRLDLAMTAIIKEEKIEVSDEDVEAEMKKMAEKYGMELEMVKKYLTVDQVRDQVMTEKAIAVVTDSAIAGKPEKKAAAKKADDGEEKPAKKPAAKKAKAADGEEKPAKKPAAKKPAKKADAE
ncbi:MAG: trigger factor [Oscillibacter sp.]